MVTIRMQMEEYKEGIQYPEDVKNAVRYGYLYRKDAEKNNSSHACIGGDFSILYWIAGVIAGGTVWDVIKVAAKTLYNKLTQEGTVLNKVTETILSDEEQLKEFYQCIIEYNKYSMAITEKQFKYIREEIVADCVGEESQKIYEAYNRLPTNQEYIEILKRANAHAEALIGQYKAE